MWLEKTRSRLWWLLKLRDSLKATPLKAILLTIILSAGVLGKAPSVAFGFSVNDMAEGYSTIVETHHKMNNMYFYGGIALWTAALFGLGRMRRGERFAPPVAKAAARTMNLINIVCVCFMVVHFAPETESVFSFILQLFERVFG